MDDFRDLLEEVDAGDCEIRNKINQLFKGKIKIEVPRMFKRIELGKYSLSVQASKKHYSMPKAIVDLDQYNNMELGIFCDEEWVNPRNNEDLSNFYRIEELESYYEEGDVPVGRYVPIELIQSLYKYLKELQDKS